MSLSLWPLALGLWPRNWWSRAELHRRPKTPSVGIYVRVRFCCLAPSVEKRPEPPEASQGEVSPPPAVAPGSRYPTKMASVPDP